MMTLATTDDIPEILALYRANIGRPGCTWHEDYPATENIEDDIKCDALFVLRDEGRIVAVCAAGFEPEYDEMEWGFQNACELARFGVLPECQGRGFGSQILRYVVDKMKDRGYDGIRLLVSKANPAAVALYDKHGFLQCGEVFAWGRDYLLYELKF